MINISELRLKEAQANLTLYQQLSSLDSDTKTENLLNTLPSFLELTSNKEDQEKLVKDFRQKLFTHKTELGKKVIGVNFSLNKCKTSQEIKSKREELFNDLSTFFTDKLEGSTLTLVKDFLIVQKGLRA